MKMVGRELIFDPSLNRMERLYVRVFGAPISGLRIRYRRLMPKLLKMLNTCSKDPQGERLSIVDIGCGTGIFSMEIAKCFPDVDVMGVDSVSELVNKNTQIADRAGIGNCRFQSADILDLKDRERFDMAVCIDNLEHIEDDSLALSNIYNCLKRKGTGLFHVPGLYRRWLFWGKKINFDVKGHVRPGYTLEDIRGKIERAGFFIVDIHYTYGWLETVSNNISYLITGADRKNKYFYALLFPLLNAMAFFGQWSRPAWGAGVAVIARKI